LRHHHGALSLETLEAQAIFAGDALSTLELDQTNRATQLIEEFMVAANAVTAIYLAAKKFPSLRRVLRDPERWSRIVQLAAELGEKLPAAPDAVALEGFLTRRRDAAPEKFADLSLSVIKLIGRGEYALDLPGGEARTLCAGGEGLHAFHRAEPSLSRSHHATALESRAGGRTAALHHSGADGPRQALH
jgi:hypothetical protein